MGLLDRCQELFNTSNLYEVLGVAKGATDAEVRRSYYKVSLQVHPDRAPEDPLATEKFQVLGKLYAVLSDKEQRAVYDEQGLVDEESDMLSQDRCWEDYWRLLFPKVTVQDILEFEAKYKGSEEERRDVIQLYIQHQGDMDAITASALCCSQEDEPRLCDIIRKAIQTGEVTAFPAFTQESEKKKRARRKRADRERQEAEELQKEMGLGDQDDSLAMMLKQRQKSREQNFNSFLSDLEAKYSKKSGKAQKGQRGKK
ncbi:dnaJ homolog subfamily C member 9 [Myripristis murdjan]|uniref:DnaJ homolog subfamily C member 9 n=1 Tax=Myripristis murdjan TaxID=586833 RepID=A0A667ZBQ0_9TELE|nr:dnaJ homolog subfamily C member 9 [Myripristis murdjan]